MATKSEIKEWLEACGGIIQEQYLVYAEDSSTRRHVWCFTLPEPMVDTFCFHKRRQPLHLLNETLTGIQGPTFAEWQRQKGREGKIQKIMEAFEEAYKGYMWPTVAEKILDAIEGEG